MPYINKPIDRNQVMITTFDALVSPESTARIINYFIDSVDLGEMGFTNTVPAAEGRPSYPPSNMAKMYLYGYRNNIRSSRKLARACEVNIEVKWLMEGLTPDFRVIADFRKDNVECMKKLYHEFTRRVTVDIKTGDVSIDGSKFKAWNSKDKNFTIHKLEERMEWLEDRTDEYLRLMELTDASEDALDGNFTKEELERKLQEVSERLERYKGYREIMQREGLSQLSLTDADSKLMKMKNGMEVAYNVQTAVDTESHILMDYSVTNAVTDHGQLSPTMQYLKDESPDAIINVIADKGYHRDEDYIECLEQGIIPNVIPVNSRDYYELEVDYEENDCNPQSTSADEIKKCLHAGVIPDCYAGCIKDMEVIDAKYRTGDGKNDNSSNPERTEEEMIAHAKEGYFVRNAEANCVYCPAGATLWQKSIKPRGQIRYCNKKMCKACPYKTKCVTSVKYPWKEIDFSKDTLEKRALWWNPEPPTDPNGPGNGRRKRKSGFYLAHKKVVKFKLIPNREKMDKRKCTSEHPFGTMKRTHDSGYFLLKGKRKVDGEFALISIGYNLSRAENMFSFEELMKRVARNPA